MKYHVTYEVEPHTEGLTREEALATEKGAATAVIIASLLYPEDGSYSAEFVTLDGRTAKALGDDEVFKAWTMLTAYLAESEELSPGKREFCTSVFEAVRRAMRSAAAADEATRGKA